jgi:hypothetical protein
MRKSFSRDKMCLVCSPNGLSSSLALEAGILRTKAFRVNSVGVSLLGENLMDCRRRAKKDREMYSSYPLPWSELSWSQGRKPAEMLFL